MWSKTAIQKIGIFDILKEEVALYDYYIRTFDVLTKNEINTSFSDGQFKKTVNYYFAI